MSLATRSIAAVGVFLVASAASVAARADAAPYPVCGASRPSPGQTSAAHAMYLAGKVAFDEAEYDKAIGNFREAYSRDCTKHDLLVIIARAYELKGDRAEAVRALETYVERVPSSPDVDTHKRRIAKLREELAKRAAEPAPQVPVAAQPPDESPRDPGSPQPPPPAAQPEGSSGGHTVFPWIVVGVGGVATTVGAVLLGVSNTQSYPDECDGHTTVCDDPDPVKEEELRSEAGRIKAWRTTWGPGLTAGGLVLVAGGLVWHFLEPSSSAAQARVRVQPLVSPHVAGLGATGTF